MSDADLCWMPATTLAGLIRTRALSPVELTRVVLGRIERLNPRLNAYCTVTAEAALGTARQAEQAVMAGRSLPPLHGVPFSVKDLSWTAGVRTMAGSRIFEHRVPQVDAPVVQRLRAAGGIMLGKTTTPEFGWKGVGDSPATGITRNPWNPALTPGGSSAGAGAAAAAGLGPLHQGSDGAGSIRIPAAFCGVVGVKPSFGRVPYWPTPNNDQTSHVGPLARTVADAALMLRVMAGPDHRDRMTLEGAPPDYVALLDGGVRGLRVAWSPTLGGLRVDPEVAAAAAGAARAFEELGASVEEVEPRWPDTGDLIRGLWSAHEAGNLARHLPRWRERMDPGLVACIEDGLRLTVVDYLELRQRKLEFWDAVAASFEAWDLLLTPALSVAAFPVGRLNPEGWPEHPWDWIGWASFAYPFNFTGQPAASVPAGFTPAGLPVGLQIVGRRFDDVTVLRAAAAFEAARPWAGRRPPEEAAPPL
jgi:aspartyl-tRNA(Asn)/glutamyl-tRNA(Gln) amidotransferase subunit A